jgi:hypothetical protein
MRRINRDRKLTRKEAAKYRKVREQIAGELPALIERHHRRIESGAANSKSKIRNPKSP